jgi:hypothetical protein
MGDDEEEQFSVEDIVAFKEQDLREYAPGVQLYVGEAMRLRAPALKQLCEDNDVEQTELREDGPYPTWTKARMIRDLMVHGVALESGEQVDPALIVPNQWKEPLDASNDQGDDTEHGGDAVVQPVSSESSNEQEDLEPASSKQLLAMLQQMQTRLESQEERAKQQGLEIIRLRANKSEPTRECGIGLMSVPLREESTALLWPSTTNAFEAKPLTTKEYQDLVRNNSSDELTLHKRPGMSPEVTKFANKVEFSLKNVWDSHTKQMVSRLEPVVTTLITSHTHVENALDFAYGLSQTTITWTDAKGKEQQHQLPVDLQEKARQLEDDLVAAQGRITAAVQLMQSETARLCGDTQAAILKKMSMGASQQLTISKQEEKHKTASMLTPALIQTMEKQRQEQKALNHALDAKSRPANQYQGKGAGRGHRPPKGGGKQKQSTRSPARPPKVPAKESASPRPAPKGKGGGKGDRK